MNICEVFYEHKDEKHKQLTLVKLTQKSRTEHEHDTAARIWEGLWYYIIAWLGGGLELIKKTPVYKGLNCSSKLPGTWAGRSVAIFPLDCQPSPGCPGRTCRLFCIVCTINRIQLCAD